MPIGEMFMRDWRILVETIVMSVLAFVVLVLLLRFLGKKMLLTTSAGSFAMTVALGNALATAALDETVDLAETTTGFLALMLMQWVLFKATARFGWLEKLTRSTAAIVFRDGRVLDDALRAQRVAEEDVYAAIRGSGTPELGDVGLVVFESSGKLSVVPRSEDGQYTVLEKALAGRR